MQSLYRFFKYFFEFFYPHICLVCGDKISLDYEKNPNDKTKIQNNPRVASTEYCCHICKSKIVFAPSKEKVLSNIISKFSNEDNEIITPQEIAFTNAVSLFENTHDFPIINLIYKLKYHGFTRIGIGEECGSKQPGKSSAGCAKSSSCI